MTPGPGRPIGTAALVLLLSSAGCWLFMLATMAAWMGKTPPPGRETDKIMLQAVTGVVMLVLWLLVGGVLVLAGTKASMPASVGVASWVLHPVLFLAGLVALTLAYDPEWRGAVAMPIVAPVLIAWYAAWLLVSGGSSAAASLGLGMWALVVAISLALAPAAFRFKEKYLPEGDAVESKPGPKLDGFMARERERRRQRGLEELRQVDENTHLYAIQNLVRDDSPVRREALEAMRKLPRRQEDAEIGLYGNYSWILPFLPLLDLQATPRLCDAARQYLMTAIRERQSVTRGEPSTNMGATLGEGIPGIEWIAKNCECPRELKALDEFASRQQDTAEVRNFREALERLGKAGR